MITITVPVPAPRGVSVNGGPGAVTWLRGDWQTREALAHQQSVHNQ